MNVHNDSVERGGERAQGQRQNNDSGAASCGRHISVANYNTEDCKPKLIPESNRWTEIILAAKRNSAGEQNDEPDSKRGKRYDLDAG